MWEWSCGHDDDDNEYVGVVRGGCICVCMCVANLLQLMPNVAREHTTHWGRTSVRDRDRDRA